MLKRYPRIAATAIGFAAATVILLIVEGLFLLLIAYTVPERIHTYNPVGWVAGQPVSTRLTVEGDTVYDVTYSLNDERYRVVPGSESIDSPNAIVFFGGSFTFGEGVEDHETLPAHIAKRTENTVVRNFALMGHGPQNMYHSLVDGTVLDLFRDKSLHVIYVYISLHVSRTIGSMHVVAGWGAEFPYYAQDDTGTFTYRGTLSSAFPNRSRLYRRLIHDPILRYFVMDIPPRNTSRAVHITADLIAASRDRVRQINPDARFTVVLYPTAKPAPGPSIIEPLATHGIHVINYQRLVPFIDDVKAKSNPHWFPYDIHPRPETHLIVAESLLEALDEEKALTP